MNDWCGRCGHQVDVHLRGGRCEELIPASGMACTCRCERFVTIGSLIGVRILCVLFWVAVVGSLPALADLIVGGGSHG